jgi:hypothetical protein
MFNPSSSTRSSTSIRCHPLDDLLHVAQTAIPGPVDIKPLSDRQYRNSDRPSQNEQVDPAR